MQNAEQKPLSVIDALASGFELILRNPWILILPVLLDLFLWLGPQISAKPLFEQAIPLVDQIASQISPSLPADSVPDLQSNVDSLKSDLRDAGDTVNLVGITALFGEIATSFPSISSIQPPTTDWARTMWFTVSDLLTLIALLIPLGLIGFLLTCLYLLPIARAVRRETTPQTIIPQMIQTTIGALGLTIGMCIGLGTLIFPLMIGATLVGVINQGIGSFIILTGMLLMVWVSLYLTYALPAIFVSGSHPWQAVLNSVSIFRFDLWSAMGLVILAYLIRAGFSIVWQFFVDNTFGIVFVMIANALLGSSLIAATMFFYADRIKWLNLVRERLRKQKAQIKG
jgi:hypothetical protein